MERYEFVGNTSIPKDYIRDVRELRVFIRKELDIYLSEYDVYQLWCQASEDWDAGWLSIDAHYEGQTREEFLRELIEKYCRRV